MNKKTLLSAFLLSLLVFVPFVLEASAQTFEPPPPPPPVPVRGDGAGSGFGSGSGNGSIKREPGATIRGKLVYEDTGAPIRYADIGFVAAGRRGPGFEYAKTDENGEFELKDVPAGEYFPTIKDRGVINPDVIYSLNLQNEEIQTKLESLFQKFSVQGLGEFRFMIRARRGAAITGAITFFDGEPAVGVPVQLIPANIKDQPVLGIRDIGRGPFSAETDDRGVYRFSGLPEGSYVVKVTEPVSHQDEPGSRVRALIGTQFGPNAFETFFPNASKSENAEVLQVFYGQTTEGINVSLPERVLYDISGSVVDKKTGRPLRNFRISFQPVPENEVEGEEASASTKAISRLMGFVESSMGRFNYGDDLPPEWSIQNLPPGKYVLTATQSLNYREAEEKDAKAIKYPAVSKEIEVFSGNLENIVIEIPAGVVVSGKIVNEDGSQLDGRVSVFAVNEETGEMIMPLSEFRGQSAKTEAQKGLFELGPVQAGKYRFTVATRDSYISSISAGRTSTNGEVFEIEEGKDITDARIVLSKEMGVLRGRVNNFVAGTKALVVLIRKDQEDFSSMLMGVATRSTEIKSDGTYELKVQPGEYSVIVMKRDRNSGSETAIIAGIGRQKENALTVELAAREIKTLDLVMPPQ